MPTFTRFACFAAALTQRWSKRPVGYVSRVCQNCSTFFSDTSPGSVPPPGVASACRIARALARCSAPP